jgi:hypothetical protein
MIPENFLMASPNTTDLQGDWLRHCQQEPQNIDSASTSAQIAQPFTTTMSCLAPPTDIIQHGNIFVEDGRVRR